MNKAFRGGRIQRDLDNIKTEYTWSGPGSPVDIISAIRADLALGDERALMSFRYVLMKDLPEGILVGYAKKLLISFQVAITAEQTENGYLAEWNVLKWTTGDAMPLHVDKMEVLRERVLEIARKNGGTDIQAHVPPPKN